MVLFFAFFFCRTCVCVCVCYLLFIVFGCSRCLGSYHIVHFGCVARFAEFWDEDPAGASRVEGEAIALAQEWFFDCAFFFWFVFVLYSRLCFQVWSGIVKAAVSAYVLGELGFPEDAQERIWTWMDSCITYQSLSQDCKCCCDFVLQYVFLRTQRSYSVYQLPRLRWIALLVFIHVFFCWCIVHVVLLGTHQAAGSAPPRATRCSSSFGSMLGVLFFGYCLCLMIFVFFLFHFSSGVCCASFWACQASICSCCNWIRWRELGEPVDSWISHSCGSTFVAHSCPCCS